MRNWKLILENASVYPETIDPDTLVRFASANHHTPQDFEDGNLYDRIWQFRNYELKTMPIADLPHDEWMRDDDMVNDYSRRLNAGELSPPIIFDPVNNSIIDGTHRLHAALASGHDTIQCYVGDPSSYEPVEADDDEYLDEAVLNEKVMLVPVLHRDVRVLKNPTVRDLLTVWQNSKWGIMRGLIDKGDIYWWDADVAIHFDVAQALGIDGVSGHGDDEDGNETELGDLNLAPHKLTLSKERDGVPFLSCNPGVLKHPRLEKLLPSVRT